MLLMPGLMWETRNDTRGGHEERERSEVGQKEGERGREREREGERGRSEEGREREREGEREKENENVQEATSATDKHANRPVHSRSGAAHGLREAGARVARACPCANRETRTASSPTFQSPETTP